MPTPAPIVGDNKPESLVEYLLSCEAVTKQGVPLTELQTVATFIVETRLTVMLDKLAMTLRSGLR